MSPLLAVDLLGVLSFALSGSLLASSKRFDILGSLLLAGLVGLGGGITRDIMIGHSLPTAFREPIYLLMPVLATLIVWVGWLTPGRFRKTLLLFDAGGLALFCVSGTLIALRAGLNPVGATLMGVTTACGGGLLRDVVANEVPSLIRRDGGLYAVPAAVGAALVVVAAELGYNLEHRVGPLEVAIIGLVLAFRAVALKKSWRLPAAGPAAPRAGEVGRRQRR